MKQNQHKVGSSDHNYDIKKVLRVSRILNFAFSFFSLKVKKLRNGTLDCKSPQFYPGIYVALVEATKQKGNPATDEVHVENRKHGLA